MAVRIGIDVGGTFTDAVAVDDRDYRLIGGIKIPTTHDSKEGVAAGIVEALRRIMADCEIEAGDVSFIAHGTTQATNALLEGDVSSVGIVTLGRGLEGIKAKADTHIGDVELTRGKLLKTGNAFVNTGDEKDLIRAADEALARLRDAGAESMVVSEAFAVDKPENENAVARRYTEQGIPATAGNEVSKLYGLKVRTRTAVINASIMPKMLEAANYTEQSIRQAGIDSPLMVMRCDGGVMTVDEVRSRPILTILSGPAAGVAGALMYEKLTDGIFLEVGGTSTDISCVRDGSVMIQYAEVGGHKTYLNSLDVRTVGIGGGSMVVLRDGKAVDIGPRSAHIAKLAYEAYADPEDIQDPVLKAIRPMKGDPEYAYIECSNGKTFALTLSGAANIAGFVPEDDYAAGSIGAARKAWLPLANAMGLSVEETANKALSFSADKNIQVVYAFLDEYQLDSETVVLVGGGGGASTVVPHLAKILDCKHRIAKNAPLISPIGVSLAMVREMVERTVYQPTEQDVLAVRGEAFDMAVHSGASPDTVEVTVSMDNRKNKLRAVAIGAMEMRAKDLTQEEKTNDELREIAAESLKMPPDQISLEAENAGYCAFSAERKTKRFFIFTKRQKAVRLIDKMGVIRLMRRNGTVHRCKKKSYRKLLEYLLESYTVSGEGGAELPNIYIARGKRIITLSGMQKKDQIYALGDVELASAVPDEELIVICTLTSDNERW
ncbi:MAG: hydantoinase/oxoprolinase family protein [Oscillospiraceae bacterium]|nr:hydantoinase/oxoprolinase family protein [Oscillospiraceae bacterium]